MENNIPKIPPPPLAAQNILLTTNEIKFMELQRASDIEYYESKLPEIIESTKNNKNNLQ